MLQSKRELYYSCFLVMLPKGGTAGMDMPAGHDIVVMSMLVREIMCAVQQEGAASCLDIYRPCIVSSPL